MRRGEKKNKVLKVEFQYSGTKGMLYQIRQNWLDF